jgi:hypothetical protein
MVSELVATDDHERVDRRVLALLLAFLRSMKRAGRNPVRTARDELERAARSFSRRIVLDAIADPQPVDNRIELRDALADDKHSSVIGGATAALAAVKLLEKIGPMKVLSKRTPWLMLATGLPTAYSSFARGADDLALVSSFLVNRARHSNHEPDPDRVRRVAVQLLHDDRVDPDAEPSHGGLVSSWAWRAVRSALPFSGRSAARHARSLSTAAASVDPTMLALHA